jgi:hypothetical protein
MNSAKTFFILLFILFSKSIGFSQNVEIQADLAQNSQLEQVLSISSLLFVKSHQDFAPQPQ